MRTIASPRRSPADGRALPSDRAVRPRDARHDRWLLFGGSWGSTLILAYAERYPDRVSEIVIPSVTTTRRSETDWLYRGVARFFPAEWERFRAGAGAADRPAGLCAHLRALLRARRVAGGRHPAARCGVPGGHPGRPDPRPPRSQLPARHRLGTRPRVAGRARGSHRRLGAPRQ